MDKNILQKELSSKMENSLKSLDHDLKGLRTGRASSFLLDPVQVEAYGSRMSISSLANISVPEARTLLIQVWDKSMVKPIEKAIVDSNLGLNPISEGQSIRLVLPPLTEDRRKELVKLAYKYAENAKIALRNIRRDTNENLKKLEKQKEISKDDLHNLSEEIQKITDEYIEKVENQIKKKEQEILSI